MIDFFGSGYEVIERLGLLWDVAQLHHPILRLAFLDGSGHEKFSIDYLVFRRTARLPVCLSPRGAGCVFRRSWRPRARRGVDTGRVRVVGGAGQLRSARQTSYRG